MILHKKSNMTSLVCKHLFFREGCIEKESDGTIATVSMLIGFKFQNFVIWCLLGKG